MAQRATIGTRPRPVTVVAWGFVAIGVVRFSHDATELTFGSEGHVMLERLHQLSILFAVLLSLLAAPRATVAQTRAVTGAEAPAAVSLDRLARSAGISTGRVQAAPRRQSRDSLKNGAVIGAVAGAAALGGFAAVICKAQQEPGGPSCVGDTLRVAAIGAAVGLGAGVAIDAALTRNSGVALSLSMKF